MKKLLYTFAIVALGLVISCEKDMMDKDADSILVPSQEIESVSNEDLNEIVDMLLDNISSFGNNKLGNATLTSKTNDYVAVNIFESNSVRYLTLLDETNDDLCFGDITPATVFFDNSKGDGSELSVEDVDGNVSIVLKGNFAAFFSGGNNVLVKLTAENKSADQVSFDANNVAAFTN